MSLDVLCIGHAAYDLLFYLDQFPSEDSKTETALSRASGGGPAANAAYLLSLWGTRCAFAGAVGDDYFGQQILTEFKSVGTDTSLVGVKTGFSTPLSLVLVNQTSGSRTVVNRKVPCSPLRFEPEALVGLFPKVLLFDGHELEASLSALTAFPTATSLLDAGSVREGTLRLAGKATYLIASERFALQATALPNLVNAEQQRSCLDALYERFKTTVVITLGERGLIASNGQGYDRLTAFPVAVADTTAAGDIFHGAFAYSLLKEKPLWDNLRFASMAAALSVTVPGGRQSIPSLERVEEALADAQ